MPLKQSSDLNRSDPSYAPYWE